MKQIPLTQGRFALVDSEDYETLNQWKWCAKVHPKNEYAIRATLKGEAGYPLNQVKMHRFIMSCPNALFVDHINGNGLDNRRQNLRVCTHSENLRNQIKRKREGKCSSKYKGIYWNKKANKWHVSIWTDEKRLFVGYFSDEIEAAKAYNAAALKYHGEFANLNPV